MESDYKYREGKPVHPIMSNLPSPPWQSKHRSFLSFLSVNFEDHIFSSSLITSKFPPMSSLIPWKAQSTGMLQSQLMRQVHIQVFHISGHNSTQQCKKVRRKKNCLKGNVLSPFWNYYFSNFTKEPIHK